MQIDDKDDDMKVRRIDANGMPVIDTPDDDVDLSDLSGEEDVPEVDDDAEIDENFCENLAETMDEHDLSSIALNLLDLIEKDKQARSRRDEQYADGIRRTGLGNDAPGGAEFDGASKVVHPVLTEGCIDFAARAIKEIFPPSGPCKTHIIGEATEKLIDKAERKKKYMNWQLTKQISEYRAETEQMLTQLPLGGSQYIKIFRDERLRRASAEFLPIDDLFLPFSVSDFYSSHRTTHRQRITKQVFESRVKSGLYRDIDNVTAPLNLEQSSSAIATDKIEGVEADYYNEDGLRIIYEIYVDYSLEDKKTDEDEVAPYIITVDDASNKILAVYRNWEDDDDKPYKCRLDWIVEYKFIPWRGAYGIGLPHIIGTMAGALTGSLRALLDAAHINNMQGMLKLKGSRMAGQTISIEPVGITEIEGPVNIDDIRKLAMPLPFNPPSAVLFQLLDWLTNQAKGVVGTAEEKIADATNDMPVGTALALIEQGSVVYSAIHARLHASQAKVLEILHRINRDHIEDEETVEELGSLIVSREDFQGPMDIIPVSDPNIFSEAQRLAQLQSVLKIEERFPQLFKPQELVKRAMQLLNFPAYEEVMVDVPEAERLDAIHENLKASEGKQPLKAYKGQDHISHMKTHLHYALSPIFCANSMMAVPALPALLAHVTKEHLPMFYEEHAMAASGAMAEVMGTEENDQIHEQGSSFADQAMAQQLAPIMEMLQKAQAAAKQFVPPPPPDPAMAQIQADSQAHMAEMQAKAKLDEQNVQMKMQQEQHKQNAQAQQTQHQNELEAQREQLKASTDAKMEEVRQQMDLIDKNAQRMFDKWKVIEDNAAKITAAEISSKTTIDTALLTAQQAANATVTDDLLQGEQNVTSDQPTQENGDGLAG